MYNYIWLAIVVLDSLDYRISLLLRKVLLGINGLEDNIEMKFKIVVIINILK